jgi:hypothetical protein
MYFSSTVPVSIRDDEIKGIRYGSVADPDPSDPYVFYFLGLLDRDPLVRGKDPDPSITKQKL